MENFKAFLKHKYVDFVIATVTITVSSINMALRHIIKIQNLDPDAAPGFYLQKSLTKAFSQSPTTQDYDFDPLVWLHEKRKEVNSKLTCGELSEEKFNELTDISNLSNPIKEKIVLNNKILNKKSKKKLKKSKGIRI